MRVFKKISYPGSVLNSEIAKNMQYGVQGEILGKEPELKSTTNPLIWGFAGYMYDIGSRKYSPIWRDYDQERGVWLSQDPIGLDGGDPNLYRYVENSPVLRVDPTGEFWWLLLGGAVGGMLSSNVTNAPESPDAVTYPDESVSSAIEGVVAGATVCEAANYKVWFRRYPRAGGGGVGIDRSGENLIRFDYHKVGKGGEYIPHVDIDPLGIKHWPYK